MLSKDFVFLLFDFYDFSEGTKYFGSLEDCLRELDDFTLSLLRDFGYLEVEFLLDVVGYGF